MPENRTEPDKWRILLGLAGKYLQAGELTEALAVCQEALASGSERAEIHFTLGYVLEQLGRLDEAVASYETTLRFRPNYAEAWSNLGDARRKQRDFIKAIDAYRHALTLKPNLAETLNNLGITFGTIGQDDKALTCFRQSLAVRPDFKVARTNLAASLSDLGQLDEAIALCREILAEQPNMAVIHNNLANSLRDMGQTAEAIASYENAMRIDPAYTVADSNRVYALHFSPAHDSAAIYHELRRWNETHAKALARFIRPHENDRSADRRLKIGYVSPYFYSQAETYFVLPLLRAHDHERFEIHCYSDVRKCDALTEQTKVCADHWHDIQRLSDEQLAEKIRADRIDIFVDLSMHMAFNRLLSFARKPAPVQVTWLAYPGGTGMGAMDYRITDAIMDPLGETDQFHAESSLRLPGCWCCYDPLTDAAPSLSRADGPIRFGSLNQPGKHNPQTFAFWAKALKRIPDSQLLLLNNSDTGRKLATGNLNDLGIESSRVKFVPRASRSDYLRHYDQIDIALDPLPYNGITTTCDALWMGVPVVSLRGTTPSGRAGASILTSVGLEELIADDAERFANIACELANDRHRLAEMRATLRERMRQSPLMDAERFARKMEEAYRDMWMRWISS